jgi:hypothetical protein
MRRGLPRRATTVDARRETASLIGSDKVEGTPVYGRDDQKIGTVQRAMLDKISGKVADAVASDVIGSSGKIVTLSRVHAASTLVY